MNSQFTLNYCIKKMNLTVSLTSRKNEEKDKTILILIFLIFETKKNSRKKIERFLILRLFIFFLSKKRFVLLKDIFASQKVDVLINSLFLKYEYIVHVL